MKTCTFEGCEKKHSAKGLCQKHYDVTRRGQRSRAGRPPTRTPEEMLEYSRNRARGGIQVPEGQRCEACGDGGPAVVHHWHGCCSDKKGGKSCGRCFVGYLCRSCNIGMGMFMDDPALMRRAAMWQEAALYRMGLR